MVWVFIHLDMEILNCFVASLKGAKLVADFKESIDEEEKEGRYINSLRLVLRAFSPHSSQIHSLVLKHTHDPNRLKFSLLFSHPKPRTLLAYALRIATSRTPGRYPPGQSGPGIRPVKTTFSPTRSFRRLRTLDLINYLYLYIEEQPLKPRSPWINFRQPPVSKLLEMYQYRP